MKEKRGEKGRENIDRLKKIVSSIGVDTPAMGQVKIPDFPKFLRSSSIFDSFSGLCYARTSFKRNFFCELLDLFGGDAWHIINQEVVQAPVDAQPVQRILGQCVFVKPPELPGGNLL